MKFYYRTSRSSSTISWNRPFCGSKAILAFHLRGEGLVPDKSGKIWMLKSKTPLRSTVGKQKGKGSLLHGAPIADSKQFAQDQHLVAMVMWSEVCFAQFAFDVLALLNGTYTNGYVSSFHGLSWMNPARQSQD